MFSFEEMMDWAIDHKPLPRRQRTPLETWEWMYLKHRNQAPGRPFDIAGAPIEFLQRHPELLDQLGPTDPD